MLSVRRSAQLGVLAGAVLLLANVAALLLVPRHYERIPYAEVGTAAPDFALDDSQGRVSSLSALKGQTVVLCFTSLHSPQASAYNPRVVSLARQYAGDSRVQFLALNTDDDVTAIQIRTDDKNSGRWFPTLIDQRARVATRYSAGSTPTFVIVDREGVIRYRGPFDDSMAESSVTQPFCENTLHQLLPPVTLATIKPQR